MGVTQSYMDSKNREQRQLSLNDFCEQMLFPHGLVEPATALAVSCHWHEHDHAYLTLFDRAMATYADFAIMRIFPGDATLSYYLLLSLLPREAGDLEKPPLYLVRVSRSNQVVVLDQEEITKLMPLTDLSDSERCDLDMLSIVLGPVPTWEELKQRS